jgi:hypothetical protein
MASLQAYIVLAQKKCEAEVFERANDFWTYRIFNSLNDTIHLKALGIELLLADVYENVLLKK